MGEPSLEPAELALKHIAQTYRIFKRNFSSAPDGAQPPAPPLGYLGDGDALRRFHPVRG